MARILVVEDNNSLREILFDLIKSLNHDVTSTSSAEEAFELLYLNNFDLILVDLKLPKKTGMDFIREARSLNRYVPIVLMTAFGTIDIAVNALKLGAQDFICKPFELDDISKLIKKHLTPIKEHINSDDCSLITRNKQMLEILRIAQKLGPLPTSVLLLGESGSGKEVLAQYLHKCTKKKASPFVGVNCASIPKNLMESEFFGHEVGAFTGASSAKEGLFEVAHNGTLFLDEVGEMPVSLQVKLLRAIQEGETRRIGSTKPKSVNVRVISATNKNLEEQVAKKEFREDLYYRLGVFVIEVPPLRNRRDDIDILVDAFINRFKLTLGFSKTSISPKARQRLNSYDWPGNVRELENIIERALIFSGGEIDESHIKLGATDSRNVSSLNLLEIAEAAQRNAESAAILQALVLSEGNKTQAAKNLGVSYKTLLTKIKLYELDRQGA